MATTCLIDRYAAYLPVTPRTPRIALGEGGTPLVRAPRLEAETGVREVWLKVEGMNPTGSFKDRGMVLAVAKAMEEGAASVICASTGNTAASAAAYAARAGLECAVVLPAGHVALGKLAQAIVFGARVIAVRGSFDDALVVVKELAAGGEATLVNSINPYRIEGQKTAAFEICETLGDAPDALFIPVGNAGNITAYWKGFVEAARTGMATRGVRMFGFQAAGAAPIVHGRPVAEPRTIATAIRIGNPASWKSAVEARDASGGAIEAVTDEEILDAYRFLAGCEGVFCEPASAASVAGLRQRARRGALEGIERIVCVLTGNGLKDPDTAKSFSPSLTEVAPTAEDVRAAIRALS
ncbi:MAG: threonine synthase [Chloroflexota bacterium]|nr:threonine synthase [Chloroflexota bacterium]MDE3101402.1 threonine synthase [Chloroflexota bacterium]